MLFSRRSLLIVSAIAIFSSGCLTYTPEQAARIERLSAEIEESRIEFEKLAAEGKAIAEKLKRGEMSSRDAGSALGEIKPKLEKLAENYKEAKTELDALKASGLSPWEIAGGVLINLLLGALGLRGVQRIRAAPPGRLM